MFFIGFGSSPNVAAHFKIIETVVTLDVLRLASQNWYQNIQKADDYILCNEPFYSILIIKKLFSKNLFLNILCDLRELRLKLNT